MVLFFTVQCYNYLENAVGLCRLQVMGGKKFLICEGNDIIMEKQCRKVVRYYFKNLFQNTVLKAVLFTAGFVLACVIKGIHAVNLILLVCGAAAIAIDYNLFGMYFKAKNDLKQGDVVSQSILVKELTPDHRHNYYKRDGSVKGSDRYILTDSCGRQYFFCVKGHNDRDIWDEDEKFNNIKMKISYLPESRLVVWMDCDSFGKITSESLSQYLIKKDG